MKKFNLIIFSLFVSILLIINVWAINDSTTSVSKWYNAPINLDSYMFKANLLDNWSVEMNWIAYNKDEKLKYYKLVRSSNNSNPVYPDDWYIKYSSDINFTGFTDTNVPYWVNYYRICAITYENNRYCSNVAKVYKEKQLKENQNQTICTMEYNPVCWELNWIKKTFWNKCSLNASQAKYLYTWECKKEIENKVEVKNTQNTSTNVNSTLKYKSEKLAKSFILKIENKYSQTEKRVEILKNVIYRLENLSKNNSKAKEIISYLINTFQDKINSYDDWFSDIESILNDY